MDIAIKPVAVTMGEPSGIGGELSLMAWQAMKMRAQPDSTVFYLHDDPERLRSLAKQCGQNIDIVAISSPGEAAGCFDRALPVMPLPESIPANPGKPEAKASAMVPVSIEAALTEIRAGRAGAMVTNPLHKALLRECGFSFPGHTEFLGHLDGGKRAVMMLAAQDLRVVPVTIHDPINQVAGLLNEDLIIETAKVTATDLRKRFGIENPRLVVAGLNPHAGENGHIGTEEVTIISPAIQSLREEDIVVEGPMPADSLFHEEARQHYDAVICMYHDQALIPLKMLDFWGGVNVTLGLSFIRVSPDHGTAIELAGQWKARPDSFIAALDMASAMMRRSLPDASGEY